MYKARTGGGRKSVSGERYDPTEDDLDVTAKVVPKSDEQRKRLQESTSKIMLLNRLDEVNLQFGYQIVAHQMAHHSSLLSKYIFQEQLHHVLDAMEERSVSEGEIVIQQGDDGDNFYIIEK